MKKLFLLVISLSHLTVYADEAGKRDFFQAICKGNGKEVETFLANREYIDTTDVYGFTPLMKAASCQKENVLQLLLNNNPNVDAKNPNNGSTALMYAVQNDNSAIVNDLIEARANVNLKNDDESDTALIFAAKFGNSNNIKALLKAHADATAVNDYGQTALMLVSPRVSSNVISDLIEAGSDVNAKTYKSSQSALMKYAQDNPIAMERIVALVKGGAEICDLDKNKNSKTQASQIYKFFKSNEERKQFSKDPDFMKKLEALSQGDSSACMPPVDENGRPTKRTASEH